MPKLRTKNGRTLEFRYEPGSALQSEGVQVSIVRITPDGNQITADQAKVALGLYPEVERVKKTK